MEPPSPITRRSFLKKGMIFAGSLLASGGLLGSYSCFVEPRWYDITHLTITLKRLPDAFIGKKLVHVSDFHLGHHFGVTQLKVVTNLVRQEKPDLLCFTGDLFDTHITDAEEVSKLLASLEAPLGKWAVLGNHDHFSGNRKTIKILKNGGFQTLLNECHTINHGGQAIQLAGVEDMLTGKPDIQQTLQEASSQICTLLLSHSANFADIASTAQSIDLQLSGHSHGGQIRLPVVGALVTPPLGDKYVMGLHTVHGSKLQVYTTRGIGTTLLPFRFLCRPEITVITLDKTKS
ncbi:metallophosphoesterase [Paenibacillus sp. SI8]|uniref:metallophosphoesterase n=1 Tax=unclassified Paenibacillus TaxID=185978 RepID=UPI003464F552